MINNNLTTLASLSANYKLEKGYSLKNKVAGSNAENNSEKKDTISISLNSVNDTYRDLKISKIKEQIKNGEYKIDNKLTSRAILDELSILK